MLRVSATSWYFLMLLDLTISSFSYCAGHAQIFSASNLHCAVSMSPAERIPLQTSTLHSFTNFEQYSPIKTQHRGFLAFGEVLYCIVGI
jgi:hypothetical protein